MSNFKEKAIQISLDIEDEMHSLLSYDKKTKLKKIKKIYAYLRLLRKEARNDE